MNHRVLIFSIIWSLLSASASAEKSSDLDQILSLSSAQGACYIDTPAFDVATVNACFELVSSKPSTAVFSVVGIEQSTGRYLVEYLNNTCDSIFTTVNEGLVCLRQISGRSTQSIRVTDTITGSSRLLSVTATPLFEPRGSFLEPDQGALDSSTIGPLASTLPAVPRFLSVGSTGIGGGGGPILVEIDWTASSGATSYILTVANRRVRLETVQASLFTFGSTVQYLTSADSFVPTSFVVKACNANGCSSNSSPISFNPTNQGGGLFNEANPSTTEMLYQDEVTTQLSNESCFDQCQRSFRACVDSMPGFDHVGDCFEDRQICYQGCNRFAL